MPLANTTGAEQHDVLGEADALMLQAPTRTNAKSPQTNGICERFHRTTQNEFYASAFRRKLYTSLEQLQADVDV